MHNHLKKHYLEFFAAVADRTHVLQKGAIPLDIFKSEELELLTEKYKGIIEEDSKPRIPFVLESHILGNVIIKRILHHSRKGVPFPEAIETVFNELETSINIEYRSNKAWTYLYEFESDMNEMIVDDAFVIRKMNFLEYLHFESEHESGIASLEADYIIETKPCVDFTDEAIDVANMSLNLGNEKYYIRQDIKEGFYDILAILRLVHPSNAGIIRIQYEFGNPLKISETVGISLAPLPELHPGLFGSLFSDICHVSQSGVEYIQKVLHQFNEIKETWSKKRKTKWHQALRRYNNALISNSIEDSIVDLIIGLEIVFRVIGFKMIYLCSNLIGLSSAQRQMVVETLDEAYKIRNRIVHGGSLKDTDKKTVEKTASIVAKTLIFMLALNRDEDTIESINTTLCKTEDAERLRDYLVDWDLPLFRPEDLKRTDNGGAEGEI